MNHNISIHDAESVTIHPVYTLVGGSKLIKLEVKGQDGSITSITLFNDREPKVIFDASRTSA